MRTFTLMKSVLAAAALLGAAMPMAFAQAPAGINDAPNPYQPGVVWAKMSSGRPFGSTIGVKIAPDGKSVWVFDRCGGESCQKSKISPVMKFDPNGNMLLAIGSGLVNDPHGLFVDRDDNAWVTDFRGKDGKGHTVTKLKADGTVLMQLGKPGVPGNGPDTFNSPSDVLVGPDGSVYVADGHGPGTNARIVKLTGDGKFVKAWGIEGKGPGEFDVPHGLAMDSKGRLFVADRSNNRIQIFDQEGKFLSEWKQFGRPSGIYIDKNDLVYVTDSTSTEKLNPGVKQGIRIGKASDGIVTAFIPETAEPNSLESVAVDDAGNVYGGYTNSMNFRRFVKK